MNKAPFVLGIIPARGGSKGIPRKNIQDLGGVPLVAHTIRQAGDSQLISDFVVSSEDSEIRQISEQFGAKTMNRPLEYANDEILQEVDLLLRWTVNEYERVHPNVLVDIVVLLYPTAPLRTSEKIDEAIEKVMSGVYDSALTAYFDSRYLWRVVDHFGIPINYDPNARMPRQKENWNQWAENKAVYVISRDLVIQANRIGSKCAVVEMTRESSVDIDSPEDLELARLLYSSRADGV